MVGGETERKAMTIHVAPDPSSEPQYAPEAALAGAAIHAGAPAAGDVAQPPRSLTRYAPAFVVLLAVLADAMQYADTDIWGHVRFGQIMLRTGHLIRHDIFSYSAPNAPWINHEWLAEVVMALFYNALGVAGLKLMKFLCAGAIVLLLAEDVGETGAAPVLQFAVLIAAAAGLQLQIQFRPQLFDYIFLSALLFLLARTRRRGLAPPWVVLPMMVVWANLHGGFFIGVVVLGLYSGVLGLQDLWQGRGLRRALRLGALTGCVALVTLINPYGLGEWQIVAHTLRNPYTMGAGAEFQSFLHVVAELYRAGAPVLPFFSALAMMAALAVSFALAPDLDDLPELAIAGLMIFLALYSVRNTAFAMIACAAPVAYHFELARVRRRRKRLAGKQSAARTVAPAHSSPPTVQMAALIAAIVLALSTGIFSKRLPDFTAYPAGAVGFMQRHGLSGRVFNRLIWGGYIVWHMAPHSTIFIDGRFEMLYPLEVQRDYIDFLRGGAGAERVLAAYPHDFVLLETGTPRYRFMMKQGGWRLVYRDPVAALFARAGSPATKIAGVPAVRDTAPPSVFP